MCCGAEYNLTDRPITSAMVSWLCSHLHFFQDSASVSCFLFWFGFTHLLLSLLPCTCRSGLRVLHMGE